MGLKELKIFVEENTNHPVFTSKIGWRAKYDELLYGDFISTTTPPTQDKLVEVINLLLRQAVVVIDELESRTSADAVGGRHGEAIYDDHDEWWGAVYLCSLCGEKWMLESASYKAHYCPYCGARMDGERKEQE